MYGYFTRFIIPYIIIPYRIVEGIVFSATWVLRPV